MDALHLNCPICHRPTSIDISEGLDAMIGRYEKEIITEALKVTFNNRAEAARRLGIPVYALRHLQMKHGLIPPKKKSQST